MGKISVIGFGKIGQAVAANILQNGLQIMAIDTNTELENAFIRGSFSSKEPGVTEVLTSTFESGTLRISARYSDIEGSDAVIVAIPLLVDIEKNILDKPFLQCFRDLAPYLQNKVLVVIETSIPVGYGRNKVVPVIESEGKEHGIDFLLAHSPERIKSGSMLKQLLVTPKIIGGVTNEATKRTMEIYQMFFDKELLHPVESIEAAELIKLAGMVYRDVNIALSNQLAQFSNKAGINFNELIPLINTDGEAHLLNPGIGVGGHCTPVYPYFLINNFKEFGLDFCLASESRLINDNMADYAVSLVKDKSLKKKALILGLGFRPGVKEDTFSTTYLLNNSLQEEGFEVLVHDNLFTINEIFEKGLNGTQELYSTGSEVCFLVTMQKDYQTIDFKRLRENGCKYFVDGRNLIDHKKVTAAGIEYFGIGNKVSENYLIDSEI